MNPSLPLLCAAVWLTAATASAQTVSEPRPPVTVSIGGGMLMPYSYPERPTVDLLASVQIPIAVSLLVEGQMIRSTSDGAPSFSNWTTDHEAINVGANLLMRTAGTPLHLFYGGGLGWHHAETRLAFDTPCEPRAPNGCGGPEFIWSGLSWQLVGGVERRFAPRLTAFGGARWLTTSLEAGDTGLGAIAGIRAALTASPSQKPAPSGPEVRVRMASGRQRTGKLVSLTSSEVVLVNRGETQTFPLDQVSHVERTTHHVRNGILVGLIGGFIGGYLASCGGGDEEDCWPEVGALFAGIGAGAGAAIGASLNASTAASRILYLSPKPTASVAPSRASVNLAFLF